MSAHGPSIYQEFAGEHVPYCGAGVPVAAWLGTLPADDFPTEAMDWREIERCFDVVAPTPIAFKGATR